MIRSIAAAAVVLGSVLVACGGDDAPPDGSSSGSSGASSSGGSSGASSGASSGSSGASSSGSVFSTEQKTGIATFYDADGAGAWNCSYPVKDGPIDVTALNFPEYAKSAACGTCFLVKGPKGSVTVRVVDSCPGCKEGHLDLSEQAFAKIANPVDGRVPITYQGVACEVSGNVSYHFKEGSSKYWTAIQVRNHKLPIAKVEYEKNGAFVNMPRSDYNYFIDTKGVGDLPAGLKLRITAVDGQTIEESLPGTITADKVFPGTAQFK